MNNTIVSKMMLLSVPLFANMDLLQVPVAEFEGLTAFVGKLTLDTALILAVIRLDKRNQEKDKQIQHMFEKMLESKN
ncbi:hypothetical protein V6R21_11650 [Limibacter armeniacum]|uniref:hypothetical protein n=1 Tax=Limibacter armeniacum TaxID=466084 RepID=UPI002FE5AC0D